MENCSTLINRKIERLTVLKRDMNARSISYICLCECGATKTYPRHALINGRVKSCGCLSKEMLSKREKHGYTKGGKSPEYMCWQGIKDRCLNEKATGYEYYGGRGIKICDRWRESFQNFIEDMGPRPLNTSIDRIDVNGDYTKENCRWATSVEQMSNTTRNKYITFNGETLTISEWSRKLGFSRKLLGARIREKGWSIEKALTTPLDEKRSHKSTPSLISHNGETLNLSQWSRKLGFNEKLVGNRLKKGWSIEKALTTPLDEKRSHKKVNEE